MSDLAQKPTKQASSRNREEARLSLAEHLEELRTRLVWVVGLLLAGGIAGWFLSMPVYEYLSGVASQHIPEGIEFKEPFGSLVNPFFLKVKLSFFVGLILTLPFTVWQIWGFISPGLKTNEKKPLKIVVPVSVLLFGLGVALCWWTLPNVIRFMASFAGEFPGTAIYQEPGSLVFLILKMMLAFGIGFQLPVVVFFLARAEIVTPATLLQYWRQVIVGIFLIGALLTPSGDMLSLSVLAAPLSGLFFVSVYAARWSMRNVGRDPALDDLDI